MPPLIVRPEAQTELLEVRKWYNNQRDGLGQQFVAAIEELFDRIRVNPEMHAPSQKDVRRGKVGKFPYVVYYRKLESHTEVLAVLHGRRNPRVWQRRA